MSRQPFFPLFLGDLLAATATWNGEQRALYTMLLAYQWFNGPLPKDRVELALMVGYRQERFDELWQRVRSKYVETDEGLLNLRCEEHRIKSRQISDTRSTFGKRGAAARWETDDKPAPVANGKDDSKRDGKVDDKSHSKTMAPSHPIPSHPDPSDPENQKQSATTDDQSQSVHQLTDYERHQRFERCKAKYPAFSGRQDWISAEKAASRLVDQQLATWDFLEDRCERYAAYCEATHTTGTQYVMRPGIFFTDENRPWAQDWNPPAEEQRANPVDDRNAREMEKFLKGAGK